MPPNEMLKLEIMGEWLPTALWCPFCGNRDTKWGNIRAGSGVSMRAGIQNAGKYRCEKCGEVFVLEVIDDDLEP